MINGRARAVKAIARTLVTRGRPATVAEMASGLRGGILVGEGDAGKTTFARMLRDAAVQEGATELVLLRRVRAPRELGEILGRVRSGATKTLILDGLDEHPECAQEIVDILDERPVAAGSRIWATSRACDAATLLIESGHFDDVYRFVPLDEVEVAQIAEGIGLDGWKFIQAVSAANGRSFLAKPGGAVLLLELYANGELTRGDDAGLMRRIAERFASASRGGHVGETRAQDVPIPTLVEAAGWLAFCLTMLEYDTIGLVAPARARSILMDDVPTTTRTRAELYAALATRLFEPVRPGELRPAYSGMPSFLAAEWMRANFPAARLASLFPPAAETLTARKAEALLWYAVGQPEILRAYLPLRPERFFRAHAAIALVGAHAYFDALLARLGDDDEPLRMQGYWEDHIRELYGLTALKEEARRRIGAAGARDVETELAAFVLYGTSDRTAADLAPFVATILDAGRSARARRTVATLLLHLCEGQRDESLADLAAVLKENAADEDAKGLRYRVLSLVYPEFLGDEELRAILEEPRDVPDAISFVEVHLFSDLENVCAGTRRAGWEAWARRQAAKGAADEPWLNHLADGILRLARGEKPDRLHGPSILPVDAVPERPKDPVEARQMEEIFGTSLTEIMYDPDTWDPIASETLAAIDNIDAYVAERRAAVARADARPVREILADLAARCRLTEREQADTARENARRYIHDYGNRVRDARGFRSADRTIQYIFHEATDEDPLFHEIAQMRAYAEAFGWIKADVRRKLLGKRLAKDAAARRTTRKEAKKKAVFEDTRDVMRAQNSVGDGNRSSLDGRS